MSWFHIALLFSIALPCVRGRVVLGPHSKLYVVSPALPLLTLIVDLLSNDRDEIYHFTSSASSLSPTPTTKENQPVRMARIHTNFPKPPAVTVRLGVVATYVMTRNEPYPGDTLARKHVLQPKQHHRADGDSPFLTASF